MHKEFIINFPLLLSIINKPYMYLDFGKLMYTYLAETVYVDLALSSLKKGQPFAKTFSLAITTLYDRRSTLCKELFSDIDTQGNHKLSHLLLMRSQQNYNLRSPRTFTAPVCKTKRFRDSFIISHCM